MIILISCHIATTRYSLNINHINEETQVVVFDVVTLNMHRSQHLLCRDSVDPSSKPGTSSMSNRVIVFFLIIII